MSELEKIKIIYYLIGFFIGSSVTLNILSIVYRDKLNSAIFEKNIEIMELKDKYENEE